MTGAVNLPTLTGALHESWVAILELAQHLPSDWTLVGGQMVSLHCRERGRSPSRLTTDGDAVLDVRAVPAMLHVFTQALLDLHFTSAGVTPSGHEHRWLRGEAQIDVLIPDNVGTTAAERRGATGSTTIQTPGGLEALEHSRPVLVSYGGVQGLAPRPHLPGALLAKARAYGVTHDPERERERHLIDAVVLASMLERRDQTDLHEVLSTAKRRQTLRKLHETLSKRPEVWSDVEGGADGVARLGALVAT